MKTASFISTKGYRNFISNNPDIEIHSTFAFEKEIILTYSGTI
jgi:hypothetical protein